MLPALLAVLSGLSLSPETLSVGSSNLLVPDVGGQNEPLRLRAAGELMEPGSPRKRALMTGAALAWRPTKVVQIEVGVQHADALAAGQLRSTGATASGSFVLLDGANWQTGVAASTAYLHGNDDEIVLAGGSLFFSSSAGRFRLSGSIGAFADWRQSSQKVEPDLLASAAVRSRVGEALDVVAQAAWGSEVASRRYWRGMLGPELRVGAVGVLLAFAVHRDTNWHFGVILSVSTVLGRDDFDGDGLPDATDGCPTRPGTPESWGCPGDDADGDGVFDKLDSCPEKAGYEANAGCPDPA